MRERERENERKIVKEREKECLMIAWKNIQDQEKMISAL